MQIICIGYRKCLFQYHDKLSKYVFYQKCLNHSQLEIIQYLRGSFLTTKYFWNSPTDSYRLVCKKKTSKLIRSVIYLSCSKNSLLGVGVRYPPPPSTLTLPGHPPNTFFGGFRTHFCGFGFSGDPLQLTLVTTACPNLSFIAPGWPKTLFFPLKTRRFGFFFKSSIKRKNEVHRSFFLDQPTFPNPLPLFLSPSPFFLFSTIIPTFVFLSRFLILFPSLLSSLFPIPF